MANDFKIILSASPDTTKLKTDLDNFFKGYKAPPVSVGAGGSSNSGSSTKTQTDDLQKLGKLQAQAYAEDAKRTAQKQADIQKLGKMQIEAYNMEIQAQKKLTDEFSKYQEQVDVFMAKSKNRNMSSPEAQTALGLRGQMQTAINDGDIDKARELTSTIKVADAAYQSANSSVKSFSQNLGSAALDIAKTVIAVQGLQFALSQFQEGVQYVRDLDKELTNIRLVTGGSKEEVEALGKSYSKMATELGVSTLEVTRGALEWERQGKSIEDTDKLIEYSTKLSVLGNMDATQSAEKLTSVMNGYKLSIEQVGPTLSKIIALDNNFATSTEKITTAMSYAANSAQEVGIDLEHLAAMEAVISHINPSLGGETLGQAMKTMTARFSDIKKNKITEDDIGINDIESALTRVNIQLRDSEKNFRPMQDIIDDLGKKWLTMGDNEQKLIIKTFAGKKRMPELMVT